MWKGPTLSQPPWKWDQQRTNLEPPVENKFCCLNYNSNLDGSSSSVLESRVVKERGPGGFCPLLFFSNENTLKIKLNQNYLQQEKPTCLPETSFDLENVKQISFIINLYALAIQSWLHPQFTMSALYYYYSINTFNYYSENTFDCYPENIFNCFPENTLNCNPENIFNCSSENTLNCYPENIFNCYSENTFDYYSENMYIKKSSLKTLMHPERETKKTRMRRLPKNRHIVRALQHILD